MSTQGHSARYALSAFVAALLTALWVAPASPQGVEVPIRLQVELLSKVVAYDRAYPERAKSGALVFVVVEPGNAESERSGEQMLAELRVQSEMGGRAHREELVRYTSPRALVDMVKARAPAVVYISAGLGDQIELIARALEGVSVLSVAVSAADVRRRAVLGFDVESGKPKLCVHLGQARLQRVAFRPELLKLARVIQ